jgi:hypothetical protein
MISYRFRRRAFLTALSGGIGLKIMLRTLEGSAQGMRSPGRLLVTHWPVGLVAGSNDALWKPTSGSVGGSPALRPFADAGLGADMTTFRGLSTPVGAGGGHEGATVGLVTGLAAPGTRSGEAESDDAFSAGPSFEQILLKNVTALQTPGPGYANSIADSRTDFGEISTKCLSYSTEFQPISPSSGPSREAKPLMPEISPLMQYMHLFSGFMPGATGTGGSGGGGQAGSGGAGGGAPQPVADALLKKLVGRRSVLDFSVEELNQVKRMAPTGARNKLSIHTDAVLAAESALAKTINTSYPPGPGSGGTGGSSTGAGGSGPSTDPRCGGTCGTQPAAPPNVAGPADPRSGAGNPYSNPIAQQDDAPLHAQAGALHLEVLKAAFVCDLIRVGTYQWSPGTNHVGFALYPGTTQPYMHHPTSHKISTSDTTASAILSALNPAAQFLFNVHTWYFARHAENFAIWKNTVDGCGNSLLDFTVVPFLTEVRATAHERTNMPGMLIGGKRLGFVHDRYVATNMTINQLWGTIAQAFGYASTDAPFAAPLAGFWTNPSA